MENNYGRSKNFPEESQEPVITSNQTGHSRMSDLLNANDSYENGWVKHPDEEEVQFVAKAINELDPEILAAMEHLSITDEDLMPSSVSNQKDGSPATSNYFFICLSAFSLFNVWHIPTTGEIEPSRTDAHKDQALSFKDPEFVKRIAQEIIGHIQKSDSIEEGCEVIYQGIEYAKSRQTFGFYIQNGWLKLATFDLFYIEFS